MSAALATAIKEKKDIDKKLVLEQCLMSPIIPAKDIVTGLSYERHGCHYISAPSRRLSMSPLFYISPMDPIPDAVTCTACDSTEHHTPDCQQYICYYCETKGSGHYLNDCPAKPSSVYFDALEN